MGFLCFKGFEINDEYIMMFLFTKIVLKATYHNFVRKIVEKTCIYTQNNVNFRDIPAL